jgi:heptaprenylglyceryl phosphate synthase
MDFVLFVFGKHDDQEKLVKLVCQNISTNLETEEVKYYYGDDSFIITFTHGSEFDNVKKIMSQIFTKTNLIYVLLPYHEDNISVNMVNEMYEHLFGKEKPKVDNNVFEMVEENKDDEFFEIFKDLFKEKKSKTPKKTLDEILDKINNEGFNKLTEEEKEQLKKYSQK